jgi:regulator of replication initiation timing
MVGNAINDVVVTSEEIASSLSSELQRMILQVVTLRIENAKLREKLNSLVKQSSDN